MVKSLLSLMFLSLFCGSVSAQEVGGVFQSSAKAKSFFNAPLKAKGTSEFTYFNENADAYIYGIGPSYSRVGEVYYLAIKLPASCAGKQVKAVSFGIADGSVVKNVKAWVGSKLPANASAADGGSVAVASPVGYEQGLNTATFSTPYTVPAEGCYVGYEMTITNVSQQAGQYPAIINNGGGSEGTCYLKTSTVATSWGDDGKDQGVIACISATLEGEFADNAVSLSPTFNNAFVAKDKAANVKVSVANLGTNAIKSLGYTYKDVASGKVSAEKTVNVEGSGIAMSKSADVKFALDAETEVGTKEKEITVTKINGVAVDENSTNLTAKGNVVTLSRIVPRKVVEEEVTATGCGPCARGYAGMKAMKDKYPDNWIGIAVHCSGVNWQDPMYVGDYDYVVNLQSGVPAAYLNRTTAVDPYFGSSNGTLLGIADDVEAAINTVPEAEVKVSGAWNKENTKVEVKSDVTFVTNLDKAPYAVAYVVLADGLTGTTDYWSQMNGYYGATGVENEPYIYEWCNNKGTVYQWQGYQFPLVEDMVYDHVAIAAKDIEKGVSGSIVAPIVADEVQSYTTTFDFTNGAKSYYYGQLSKNVGVSGSTAALTAAQKEELNLLQDKSKLHVVAMLINTNTGEIVNADVAAVTGATAISGVNASDANATEVARYTVDGRKINTPVKGLNIVKMSDGRTMKVIVK